MRGQEEGSDHLKKINLPIIAIKYYTSKQYVNVLIKPQDVT